MCIDSKRKTNTYKVVKVNELMIGDWVRYGKRYMKVTQLAEDMDCDDVEPIPLTPEILEKNGFVKQEFEGWEYMKPDDNNYSYLDYRILWRNDYDNHLFIKKYKGSNTSATLQIIGINYVQQLQDALRLCGIEKEIVI